MAEQSGSRDVERFGYQQELKRSLSFWDLLIYGLIFMVPIAPFGIFGSVFGGSGGMVALAYAVGAVGMVFTALSYAQMSKAFPLAGSVYAYAGRGIAPPFGFIAGWQILLDYILVPALLYIISGIAMNAFVPGVPVVVWVVGFIVLNTVVNYFGIELTAHTNRVMLVVELVVLAVFLVVGIVALAGGKATGDALSPLYDGDTFSVGLIFSAVSLAALSFLGFDAISTLSEENREAGGQIARATVLSLLLVAVLFIVQTWVAALLVPDRERLLTEGDTAGTAFYDAAEYAGGHWLYVVTAVTTAVAWGFADALVAQAATSRLLYSMARDRQLPRVLAKVHPGHRVPENATFLVAAISVAVGVGLTLRDDNGVSLLTTLVNFGALTAFLLLHVSVIVHYLVRQRSRDYLRHLVFPLCGIAILGYVVVKAKVAAQTVGLVWLGIGLVVMAVLLLTGRAPRLSQPTREDA
ncbi:APC family permease [Actinophytocola oryzae]|uniref:Amino acid/polyamine/organocation transporter (APC superfamily) n=1 Tax=Actinophytocola oryzae TaxID=502181 RepID=A0A4R7UW01_9PSEU|nr:APC family permease [Actinophytocola oryzae]TDV40953.1 amino acid/polyamine/organocation transporter (APC superfamily) [Actinophytocola oryzae]